MTLCFQNDGTKRTKTSPHQRSKTKTSKKCLSIQKSLSVLCNIVESIKNADFHSIVVNETSDVSNKEQNVLCVCVVDEKCFSYEDF